MAHGCGGFYLCELVVCRLILGDNGVECLPCSFLLQLRYDGVCIGGAQGSEKVCSRYLRVDYLRRGVFLNGAARTVIWNDVWLKIQQVIKHLRV